MESINLKGRRISHRSDFSLENPRPQTHLSKLYISPFIKPKVIKENQSAFQLRKENSGNKFEKWKGNDDLNTPRCKISPALRPSIHRKLKSEVAQIGLRNKS